MSQASGTVKQNTFDGTQLLFTDTGSYTAPVSSRVLTIYDANNNLLFTFNMGASLTQIITITADAWFKFILSVTDANGVVPPAEVDYVAVGFYTVAYLNQFTSTNCGCQLNTYNLQVAENMYNAALRFNLAGNGIASNANIIGANVFVNMSPVVAYN